MMPPPWSTDKVLSTYRFTNVYRELDPGTQYALSDILETSASKPDKIFNIMIYRLIGRSETHSEMGFQHLENFSRERFERSLRRIKGEGKHPPFTGAYTVSAYASMGSSDKIGNISRLVELLAKEFNGLYARLENCGSAEEAFRALRSSFGFGDFLAYQVLVDLLYQLSIPEGKSILPFSPNDWAIAGPGAKKGISMLLEENSINQDLEVMRWLYTHQKEGFLESDLEFPYLKDRFSRKNLEISLSNIENCLCEFYKYLKISSGEGRARRRFFPESDRQVLLSVPE